MSGEKVNLRPLWGAILNIYAAYQAVCEKHHLRYYAAFGTALGAVRHKGFIPWDDDFDVMMPRKDYEKFFDIAEHELPSCYRPVSLRNMPDYPLVFGKVQDVRHDVVAAISEQTGHPLSQGIYIDVFPFDGVPKKMFMFDLQGWILRLKRNAQLEKVHTTFSSKIGYFLGWCLRPFYWRLRTNEDFLKEDFRRAARIPFDEAEIVGMYSDLRPCQFSDFYRREWFDETVWADFENVKVPLPQGVDGVLTEQFGDYMTLPPEDQRVFTHQKCPTAPWKYGPVSE